MSELDKLLILAGASLALGVVISLVVYQRSLRPPLFSSRELALFRDPRLVPLEPIPIPAN